MKRHSRVLCAVTLVALPIFLIGCGPDRPSADPRNTAADSQGAMSPTDQLKYLDSRIYQMQKYIVDTVLKDPTLQIDAIVATENGISIVYYPTNWEFVSIQRHSLPLDIDIDVTSGDTRPLAAELNYASERLSRKYTVAFAVLDDHKQIELRTLTIPGETVRLRKY